MTNNKHSKSVKTIVTIFVVLISAGLYISVGYLKEGFMPPQWYLAIARGVPAILSPFIPGIIIARISRRTYWGIILSVAISYIMYLGGKELGHGIPEFVIQSLTSIILILFLMGKLVNPNRDRENQKIK